jgi:hypothetical protein
MGSVQEFVGPAASCWVSLNEAIHTPRLERDGRPLSPLLTGLFTEVLGVYRGQRELVDPPSLWNS